MNKWTYCPRCGHGTFENLGSYSHCVECLHFSDSHEDYETTLIRKNMSGNIARQKAKTWLFTQTINFMRPSPQSVERALANAVARQHEEQMRIKAVELSLGIYRKGDWSDYGR